MDKNETSEILAQMQEAHRLKHETPREKELRRELAILQKLMQDEFRERSNPIIKELTDIEAKKPPSPVAYEGRIYEYKGPMP